MTLRSQLRQSGLIARIEWTRHRRESTVSTGGRIVRYVVVLALAVGLGTLAHSVGRDLVAGETAALEGLWIVASAAFGWIVWRSSQLTRVRFEQLEPDFLLTTVPAPVAALGHLLFVAARVGVVLAAPTVGLAAGTALGLGSATVALTVAVAVAGTAALAVTLGVAGRLGAQLVGQRLARARLYRDLLVVFGWLPLLAAWLALRELSISITVLFAWLESLPIPWIVDLALLGTGERTGINPRRGLSALGVLVLAVPSLAAGTVVLARRLWETDPISSPSASGWKPSLIEPRLKRVLGDRVSRPVRTIARVRWLLERRVLRGLLSTGYVLLVAVLILLPAFSVTGLPLLLLIAICLGLAAGIAFGNDPMGVEYRTAPLLFTTVGGRQFVRGYLLAGLGAGIPLVTVVVVPLGLVSPAGLVETATVALVGIAVSACTTVVCVAVGMGVDRDDLVPVPFFFTDVPVYAELGWLPLLRLGGIIVGVSLVGLPAYVGNAAPVYETMSAIGVPTTVVRAGSALLTVFVAVGVTRIAYRIAVRRYQSYQI